MAVAGVSLRKLPRNPRFYLLLGMMVLFVYDAVTPIREFSMQVGYRVTPWVFSALMSSNFFRFVFPLGLVLLFCDAPFMDAGQPLLMVRAGKKNWCAGQLIYIAVCAGVYFLTIFIIQCLALMPYLTFQPSWGRVITTISATTGTSGSLFFSRTLIEPFSGITTTLLYFIALWLAGTMLGAVMFLLNLRFKRAIGAMVAAAIILTQGLVQFIEQAAKLSPFSFIQPRFYTGGVYIATIYAVLFALLLILTVLSIRVVLTKDISTLPEI
jgi:hypothetical protein